MINSQAVPVFTEAFWTEMVAWVAIGLGLLAITVALVRR